MKKNSKLERSIYEINSKIMNCTLCGLHQTRTRAVPGNGTFRSPEIMFIGEGPGKKEDQVGEPFVGSAGKTLDSALSKAGIDRSKVFITNIVKCRPPKNRRPLPDEIETCTSNYLQRQIELIKPRIICTLGATALEHFTSEKKIGNVHGKLLLPKHGIQIFASYHPAAIFRNRKLQPTFESDIGNLKAILESSNDYPLRKEIRCL